MNKAATNIILILGYSRVLGEIVLLAVTLNSPVVEM
jgi:hypothetical protein